MSYLVVLGSRKDDVVLDPFVGSGTTCIAAKLENRKYLGMELDDEYDLMPRLWKKFLTCFNIERSLKYRGKQQLSICKEYAASILPITSGVTINKLLVLGIVTDSFESKSNTSILGKSTPARSPPAGT